MSKSRHSTIVRFLPLLVISAMFALAPMILVSAMASEAPPRDQPSQNVNVPQSTSATPQFTLVEPFETHNWYWVDCCGTVATITSTTEWHTEGNTSLKLYAAVGGFQVYAAGVFDTADPDQIVVDVKNSESKQQKLKVEVVDLTGVTVSLGSQTIPAYTDLATLTYTNTAGGFRILRLIQEGYADVPPVTMYVDNIRFVKGGVPTVWDHGDMHWAWNGAADGGSPGDWSIWSSEEITTTLYSPNFGSTASQILEWDATRSTSTNAEIMVKNLALNYDGKWYFRFDVYRPSTTPNADIYVSLSDGAQTGSSYPVKVNTPDQWTTVMAPMHTAVDLSHLTEIHIGVTNTAVYTSGRLYIDNLQVGGFTPEPTPVNLSTLGYPHLLKDYSTPTDGNNFFGLSQTGAAAGGVITPVIDYTTYQTLPALRVDYDLAVTDTATISYSNSLNLTSTKSLFSVFLKGGTANPGQVKLEFHDRTWATTGHTSGAAFAYLSGLDSTTWQQWLVPITTSLQLVGSFDPAQVVEVVFSLDNPAVSAKAGRFYIDDPTFVDASDTFAYDKHDLAMKFARDTWNSFTYMQGPGWLFPTDHFTATGGVRAKPTSPTNIANSIWSTIAARDLGFITPISAELRISATIGALNVITRHVPSGQFYNWYDAETGDLLLIWPDTGSTVHPFASTVDNGWLAASLIMVKNAVTNTQIISAAQALVDSMDFSCYYNPVEGQLRGGFWPDLTQSTVHGNYCGKGPDVAYTGHHYGTFNTEPRIASYVGIGLGQIPPAHYYKLWRTFPDNCDWAWPEMRPTGTTRTYTATDFVLGQQITTTTLISVPVYEGHHTYRGMNIIPSWGGSMFEALMPNLLVPEAEWGPGSWGINHPLYAQAQIEHGLEEAQYGYWGFSPSSEPGADYREYGVDALGMSTDGYGSNVGRTYVDYGFAGCGRDNPAPLPQAADYVSGVVTLHASFLALEFAENAAFDNVVKLGNSRSAYDSNYGFYDAIQVSDGAGHYIVSDRFYALDQGMVMGALANYLLPHDQFKNYFANDIAARVQPLLQAEQFTAGRNPDYALTLGPGLTRTVTTNTAVAYPHLLRNTGQASDTYTLQAVSAHGWPVSLSAYMVTLPLDHFQTITVTVQSSVPMTATDRVTLTATSVTSPTVKATVVDTTTRNCPACRLAYLPIIFR